MYGEILLKSRKNKACVREAGHGISQSIEAILTAARVKIGSSG